MLKQDSIAEFAHNGTYGVDVLPLLPEAVQSPLGRLFLRWIALLAEFDELSRKRDRVANEHDGERMASMLATRCKACVRKLGALATEIGGVPPEHMNDLLRKLAIWRLMRHVPGMPASKRDTLFAAVQQDLTAIARDDTAKAN